MSRPKPATSSRRTDRGSASVELLILLPALFAVMFVGMQAALFFHARTVAIAAAQEGARAAGSEHGRESDGVAAATSFVTEAGADNVLTQPRTTAVRTATTASVTVEGFSLSVIPGWKPMVRQSATVPTERLTTP